jgi:hypothetical protein
MAELDVQPKKRSVLPWVLVALVILALLAFFVIRETDLVEDVTGKTIFTDSTEAYTDTTYRPADTMNTLPADTTTMR